MTGRDQTEKQIPVHSLDGTHFPVCVREIQHKNPYDFTRVHRHDYFEILFFTRGGGSQLIDFIEYPVKANSAYIVFPRQVHLLNRGKDAIGLLIQFPEEAIHSINIKSLLRQISYGENPAVLFEEQPENIVLFHRMLEEINLAIEKGSTISREISIHYLQAMLLQLLENFQFTSDKSSADERSILIAFQHLLDEKFMDEHLVQHYANELHTTEKKLSGITKKYLGSSPLQVIHDRLLLEAKRLLIFENVPLKEIAFSLGFDSPASFSHFIRKKTGQTPSELSTSLVEIHK